LELIAKSEGMEYERVAKAAAALVEEGMIMAEEGGVYHV
jgi:hypothetical protein